MSAELVVVIYDGADEYYYTEQDSYYVYRREFFKMHWPAVPVEGQYVEAGGQFLRVYYVAFCSNKTVEIRLEGESYHPAWHEALLHENYVTRTHR